ncbi:tryptophan--tRNA ligase [Patescibacteria group bacterium]|nr:tryptophan--tRNA ligase [Patescibacteria group bacterium]
MPKTPESLQPDQEVNNKNEEIITPERVDLSEKGTPIIEKKDRILTGMRPTGSLHLGHYVGALENWIKLQGNYDCHFLIADYQAFGDYADNISKIRDSVIEVAMDWLSVGLDPHKTTFVIQSYVPEHAELAMLLSMIIPKWMIDRNPTLKAESATQKDVSLGFYNYPASQAADILLPKANLVPVGEDQLPHIELTREIARKFNRMYGHIFPIPTALVGRVPRLVGIDGKAKMSKSLGNCVYLSDSPEVIAKKVKKMFTDPTRLKATDPGHLEGNVVFTYLDAFHPDAAELESLKKKYTEGKIGDGEVKNILAELLNAFLEPIRERRAFYQAHPEAVREALLEGTEKAKKVAAATMLEVREAMEITGYEDIKNIKKIIEK